MRNAKGQFMKGSNDGERHQFSKNHKPWNKDLKGIHLNPETELLDYDLILKAAQYPLPNHFWCL